MESDAPCDMRKPSPHLTVLIWPQSSMEPPTARPASAEDADIASMACQFLISQNYLLSAFELMVEAQVQCCSSLLLS